MQSNSKLGLFRPIHLVGGELVRTEVCEEEARELAEELQLRRGEGLLKAKVFDGHAGNPAILWMDKLLQQFETMRNHLFLLVGAGESSFQGF